MSVSPDQVAKRLRDEARAREERARSRADELRARLGAGAAILRAAGASQVWLFGSLADGDVPRADSDVDLAVAGLAKERYFGVLAALMTLFGTAVDLVTIEDAPESLRERIRATGRPL